MAAYDERTFRLTYPDDPTRRLRGRIAIPHGVARPAPCVLILHGFMGFMDWGFFPWLAERLVARGFAAVRFDLSGSGVGEDGVDFSAPAELERDTPSRSLEDLARVRAFVEHEVPELDGERVALVGHSRGGTLALLHAADRPDTRAVVAWNALASFARWDATVRSAWRRDGYLPITNGRTRQLFRLSTAALDDLETQGERLEPTRRCRALTVPVLLVCGAADETVAPSATEALAEAIGSARARVERVSDAGHTFGAKHPFEGAEPTLELAVATTETFLGEHLESASG